MDDVFHLAEVFLDLGQVSDWLLECDTLRSISTSVVQSSLCKTKGRSNNQAAFELELLHEKLPAHARFAKTHILGKNYVIEELVNEWNCLLANLFKVSNGEARGIVRDEPQGVLVVFVRRIFVLSYNHGVDRKTAKGNPGLLTIQDISAVWLLLGNAGHSVVVGTSSRFRNCRTSDAGALNIFDSIHDHFLLFFGAEVNYVGNGIEVGYEGKGNTSELMKLFYQKNLGKLVYWNATNFLRKAKMHEACFTVSHSCFYADMMVYFVGLLYRFIGEIAASIFTSAFNQQFLFVSKLKIHNYDPLLII